MTDQYDRGMSLKDDIASIRTDPTFHDVVLVCADGVEIGVCRAILASRSAVFKAMLYGNMQESISGKVSLNDVKSAAMHAVLRFIHTEDIDSNAVAIAIEVYRAASFFLLPKLMELALNLAHDITDPGAATPLLNDAATSMPWNDNTEELYDVVFKPFCANSLAVGDLNGLCETALELLLMHTKTVNFKTSEYDLLLCVIEWIWARDTTTPPTAERHAIFDNINSLPTELSIKIRLQSEPSRTTLMKLLNHFDLTLICPHRFKCLIKSINVFDELPQYTWAFCYQACENTKCDPAHPSRSRGEPSLPKLQWHQSNPTSGLVFSEESTVVENPIASNTTYNLVRASTKCSADSDGICKWTIVIESLGYNGSDVGLAEESFGGSQQGLHTVGWCLFSLQDRYSHSQIYYKNAAINSNNEVYIKKGDIVTFHLDLNSRTCALSVNEHNCGVAWRDLPNNVNLYPGVVVRKGCKYRIKRCK